MGLKKYKPTTSGRRYYTVCDFSEITTDRPEKSLLKPICKTGGRNNQGRITSRWIGRGHKRQYRMIDFKRDKLDIPANVASIEYDPNRSARIALLNYADGEKRYILAPIDLKVGTKLVSSSEEAEIISGNSLPLRKIPLGIVIHNVELRPGGGGKIARAAGTSCQLIARESGNAFLRLPSGEIRMVSENCRATIGMLGNTDHENVVIGKAGRSRWLGKNPEVRGVAMNPVDHPLGGGEGRSSGGRHPCSPWGKPAKGGKTRRNKRTDKSIIKRRKG